jgi:hypothetical protein
MYKLTKLPFITATIALIIIILTSAIDQVSLNVLSMRIIIFGIIFYFLGLILKYFLNAIISEIEIKKSSIENDNEISLNEIHDEKIKDTEEADKNNKEQNEKELDTNE